MYKLTDEQRFCINAQAGYLSELVDIPQEELDIILKSDEYFNSLVEYVRSNLDADEVFKSETNELYFFNRENGGLMLQFEYNKNKTSIGLMDNTIDMIDDFMYDYLMKLK